MKCRGFLQISFLAAAAVAAALSTAAALRAETPPARPPCRPNVVFLLADQWRAQATGYAGDPNVKTPHLDRLASVSVDFRNAVSGCPVCCPYRGSLMTGRYPLTHGVFLNDVPLSTDAVSLAQAFRLGGYRTAYIGKWHLDGHGRSSFIPPERRQGFQYWRAAECTHDYNHSHYYADDPAKRFWNGYDAIAQTDDAIGYIGQHRDAPFLLVLSWGPPHAPYLTAPERFRRMYDPAAIELPGNVSPAAQAEVRKNLAGYYAHCTALDECVGRVLQALADCGLADDTIVVFTSDHGDMLGSRDQYKKQRPWDESIRVPLLIRWPAGLGDEGRRLTMPINTPDLMPTLLGLCGLEVPATVEGTDFARLVRGEIEDHDRPALITCPSPFGQWPRGQGGREYRGIRTSRYTYVRSLEGPWLLFDNQQDPLQQHNLCGQPEQAALQAELESQLQRLLQQTHDEFLPGPEYIRRWGYHVDAGGTVPYAN